MIARWPCRSHCSRSRPSSPASRCSTGAGWVLMCLVALQDPGLTASGVEDLGPGLVVLLTVAKAAGAGAVLASVLVKVRELARP